MITAVYEVHLVCDNCGNLVSRKRVDTAEFERIVEEEDAVLPEIDPDGRAGTDEGDLIFEEEDRPVEVLVRHTSVCSQCAGSP